MRKTFIQQTIIIFDGFLRHCLLWLLHIVCHYSFYQGDFSMTLPEPLMIRSTHSHTPCGHRTGRATFRTWESTIARPVSAQSPAERRLGALARRRAWWRASARRAELQRGNGDAEARGEIWISHLDACIQGSKDRKRSRGCLPASTLWDRLPAELCCCSIPALRTGWRSRWLAVFIRFARKF